MDTFATVPPVGLAELHMDPPDPVPYTGEGMIARRAAVHGRRRVRAAAGPDSDSPLVPAEIRDLGCALFRSSERHGALDTFDAEFLTFGIGMVFDDETYRANRDQLRLLRRHSPVRLWSPVPDFTEESTEAPSFYEPDAYRRLQAAKPGSAARGAPPVAARGAYRDRIACKAAKARTTRHDDRRGGR